VLVLGAFALFLGFLLLDQDALGLFQSVAETTRLRYIGGEPISDFIMLFTILAAVGSLLLTLFWPKFEPPKQQFVIRHYFGHSQGGAASELAEQSLPSLRYYLTAMVHRVRHYFGMAKAQ